MKPGVKEGLVTKYPPNLCKPQIPRPHAQHSLPGELSPAEVPTNPEPQTTGLPSFPWLTQEDVKAWEAGPWQREGEESSEGVSSALTN